MLRLLVLHDKEEQVFAVPEKEAKLGSSSENDLLVRASGISRRHAIVRRVPGGVEVVDLGSKNGLYVEGRRVERTLLVPGLAVQIGAAWLELEEISSSSESLAQIMQNASWGTTTVESLNGFDDRSPEGMALALAHYLVNTGPGTPGDRTDLLIRIKSTLGAEVFATFEKPRRGAIRILESEGTFSSTDTNVLASLATYTRSMSFEQITLKREGQLIIAGRDCWFVGIKLPEEVIHEGWRKDLIRILAHHLFAPVRTIDDRNALEASRVLGLTGNKKRTADLLGISRGTLYKLLAPRNKP